MRCRESWEKDGRQRRIETAIVLSPSNSLSGFKYQRTIGTIVSALCVLHISITPTKNNSIVHDCERRRYCSKCSLMSVLLPSRVQHPPAPFSTAIAEISRMVVPTVSAALSISRNMNISPLWRAKFVMVLESPLKLNPKLTNACHPEFPGIHGYFSRDRLAATELDRCSHRQYP